MVTVLEVGIIMMENHQEVRKNRCSRKLNGDKVSEGQVWEVIKTIRSLSLQIIANMEMPSEDITEQTREGLPVEATLTVRLIVD